jgi:hypothetical protein
MTPGAGNARLKMGRVAEFDMGVGREAVDTYPGNLNILLSVSANLLHFRFVLRQFGMTEHAFSEGRYAGLVADIGADMAIDALHPQLHVGVVRECDGLLGRSRD